MRKKKESAAEISSSSESWSLQSKQQKAAWLFKQNCRDSRTQDKNEILAIPAAQEIGISNAAGGILHCHSVFISVHGMFCITTIYNA